MVKGSRIAVSAMLAVALILSGCGGAKPPAQQEQKAPERTVKHVMGETPVPADPQRIVVLDTGELDSMVALGIKPIGAVTPFQGGDYPEYLKEKLSGVQNVGTISQPNLEAIAALQPDLILSSQVRHKEIYDKLSQIAPTVFTEKVGVTWKENFRLHAEAVGRADEAQQIMADYDKRTAEFRQRLGDRAGKMTISIIRGLSDHVRIYMQDTFIHTVVTDAGLARPAAQDKPVFMEKATEERIPDLDGDLLVYTQYRNSPEEVTMVTQLMESPLWQNLSVVRAGEVYEMADDHWMLGIGITAANRVLDDLFSIVK